MRDSARMEGLRHRLAGAMLKRQVVRLIQSQAGQHKKNKPMKIKQWSASLTIAAAVAGAQWVSAAEIDLSAPGTQILPVAGDVGGIGFVSDFFTQPAGTGVFLPFLTVERPGGTSTENGYNTDGQTALYLDQQRPEWNNTLKLGDLAVIGGLYYAFELDANEPGGDKSIISIDNVRIYTSSGDNTGAVGSNLANLDSLGTLRWAMNDPLKVGSDFNIDTWIKLDSNQENVEAGSNVSNGGSGKSDMILLVPITAFAGAALTDFVWFYNLNGVHYTADGDLAAEAGFEEWRAVVGPNAVPDNGGTLLLLGGALLGIGAMARFQALMRKA